MPRPAGFENWPFKHCWGFAKTTPQAGGHVAVQNLDTNQVWVIPVVDFDRIAQEHMANRKKKPGQKVTLNAGDVIMLPDGRRAKVAKALSVEIPYDVLDEEADRLEQRQMQASADRSPLRVVCKGGFVLDQVPRDWFESLAAAHVQRRRAEPAVTINVKGAAAPIGDSYCWFDAICKNFVWRRADFLAANWWPELLVRPEIPKDPSKPGPMPVDGRPNSLGENAQVMTPQQLLQQAEKQKQLHQAVAHHPATENPEGLI